MKDFFVLAWVAFIFFGAVFFTGFSVSHLLRERKIQLDKGFVLALSACFIAVLMCFSMWPPRHHIYDDEFVYISQSHNILLSGRANITVKGSLVLPEAFISWAGFSKLPGFAWLQALTLLLTGNFDPSYFALNIILGVLCVAVVYRIVWLLTANHLMAWWSAVFLACYPVHIRYSMSTAADIAGFFFLLLFFLFLVEYKSHQNRLILYASLFSGLYSFCIRPLGLIFVIPGFLVALYTYHRRGLLPRKLTSQILLDAVCLSLPILAVIFFMLASDLGAGAYSLSFVPKNLSISVSYLFDWEKNTVLTTLAALIAVLRNIYKKDPLVTCFALWFLGGILSLSAFYAGGISYRGVAYPDRYILLIAFPFVFLAAKGVVDISSLMRRPYLWWAAVFIILVVSAPFALRNLASEAKNNFHYKKALLLQRVARIVPAEAYIIEECAQLVIITTDRKSIQTELFLSGDHPPKVVYFQGLYDLADRKNTRLAEKILREHYHCKPLAPLPFKQGELLVNPVLCARK